MPGRIQVCLYLAKGHKKHRKRVSLKVRWDWQQILLKCKDNVQASVKPYKDTIKEPQPNLGVGAGGDAMKPMDLAAETAIVDTLKQP